MTEIAQIYVGNLKNNNDLSKQLTTATYLEVNLKQSDRAKGRIHARTDSGIAVGIIKSRDRSLQEGDIFKTESGKLVLIHLQVQEVLVLEFSALSTNILPARLVYLGHVLGNHHYPIAIENNKIYVQLVTDKTIIEKTIKDLNISGLKINYEKRSHDKKITFSSHSH